MKSRVISVLAALVFFFFFFQFLKDCSRIKGSLAPSLFEIISDEIKKENPHPPNEVR